MRRCWLIGLTALSFLLPLAKLPAQAPSEDTPALVVRFSSLDALIQNAKLFDKVIGDAGAYRQVEGLIKAKIGAKGFEGIDTTRPVGAYLRFGKEIDQIYPAILLPVVDDKSFLGLLEKLNIPTNKGKGDIYTIRTGKQFDLYCRFVNRYVYVSALNPENLADKNLLAADKVLAGKSSFASANLRLDKLPEGVKAVAMAQIEQKMQEAGEKAPDNETPEQKQIRLALNQEFTKILTGIIKDGSELGLNLDFSNQQLSIDLSLSGRPKTPLAQSIALLGTSQSLFAPLVKLDGAITAGLDVSLSKELATNLFQAIEKNTEKSIAEITDEVKRTAAKALFDAILPTLKSGRLDTGLALVGSQPGAYSQVVGIRLEQGEKLHKTIRGLLEAVLQHIPESEKDRIHLDAATVGTTKIHSFDIPDNNPVGQALQMLYGSSDLHLAIRDDALFIAAGKQAMPLLKTSLGNQTSAASPVMNLNLDLARLTPIIAKTDAQKEIASKVLVPGQDHSVHLRATGGNQLTIRLDARLSVIEYLARSKKEAP